MRRSRMDRRPHIPQSQQTPPSPPPKRRKRSFYGRVMHVYFVTVGVLTTIYALVQVIIRLLVSLNGYLP